MSRSAGPGPVRGKARDLREDTGREEVRAPRKNRGAGSVIRPRGGRGEKTLRPIPPGRDQNRMKVFATLVTFTGAA